MYGILFNTIVTISGVAQLAMGYTATKYVAEFRPSDKDRVGRIIGFCSVVSGVTGFIAAFALAVFSTELSQQLFKNPQLSHALAVASATVFLSVINGYQTGAVAGLEGYRAMSRMMSAASLVNLVLCAVCAYLGGLEGAIYGTALSALFQWYVFRRALNRECQLHGIRICYKKLSSEARIFVNFALPAAAGGLITMPAIWLANVILVRHQDGFVQMAHYSVANSLCSLVAFLPLIANRVGVSLINSEMGRRDQLGYKNVFWLNFSATCSFLLIGAIIVGVLGELLLQFYGSEYAGSYSVLLILLVATAFDGVANALYQLVQSKEKLWHVFFFNVIPRDAALVVLAYLLTPTLGATGLAIAYAVSRVIAMTANGLLGLREGLGLEASFGADNRR